MSIPIPIPLVEFILLGPMDDRRQLQDSPILGDVWVAFGKDPAARLDLLIAPFRGQHAGAVAGEIDKRLTGDEDANIAYLQGLVVARLTFKEILEVVVPMTKWWINKWMVVDSLTTPAKGTAPPAPPPEPEKTHRFREYTREKLNEVLGHVLGSAKYWHAQNVSKQRSQEPTSLPLPSHEEEPPLRRLQERPPRDRFVALTALLLWAAQHDVREPELAPTMEGRISYILEHATVEEVAEVFAASLRQMLADSRADSDPMVWQLSLNRHAMPAISRSVPAVKADAATTLFQVDCKEIGWAVVDSGIAGGHPAFKNDKGESRVRRSFDFKNFRTIVSLSNSKPAVRARNVALLTQGAVGATLLKPPDNPDADLKTLAEDARKSGPVHWELVERFVEIKCGSETEPDTHHGTHVAGIIGASKKAALASSVPGKNPSDDFADGMCPNIQLYDFRVLGSDLTQTEFAIIAALQFIRYLNDRDNFLMIHGANLSLSIPHDVRNFACGRTPICDECDQLVSSGVVVVAAAGNHGYKSFETKEGYFDSYTAFSITDPGNADSVITVGATHRFWPHTYGVSFFSSRGPTGDGRMKPDLVAPGERIKAPIPGDLWGDLDGTSMAAPHVSGAAAMLMARYSELIGQPQRIKRILLESATDLGRERSFQGHGMLDVLRSFQSI